MSHAPFDRVRLRRVRPHPGFAEAGFLFREIAARLLERIEETNSRFALAAEIGAGRGGLAERLPADYVVRLDLAAALVTGCAAVVADEEALPLAPGRFDLICSNLALHTVNDLPGVLIQMRQALAPGGRVLASLIGGASLSGLRHYLLAAESDITGRAVPRVAPMVDVRDLGGLLQRAGFAEPVSDIDRISVTYRSPLRLFDDLRAMGERNPLAQRAPLRRDVLAQALARWQAAEGTQHGLPVGFEILYLSGRVA
ncbi:MAG: methyltransferase domain-containing protein [Rhodothalassiaceae bacterium]